MNQSPASDLQIGSKAHPISLAELDKLQEQIDQLRVRMWEKDETADPSEPDLATAIRIVRGILRTRRRREAVFGAALFGEPAWDLLLELYASRLMQQKLSVSAACAVAAVPATTALRWINKLETDGWIEREEDPLDRRRYWVALTDRGAAAMRSYLRTISPLEAN